MLNVPGTPRESANGYRAQRLRAQRRTIFSLHLQTASGCLYLCTRVDYTECLKDANGERPDIAIRDSELKRLQTFLVAHAGSRPLLVLVLAICNGVLVYQVLVSRVLVYS